MQKSPTLLPRRHPSQNLLPPVGEPQEKQESPSSARLSRGPLESSGGANQMQENQKGKQKKASFCFSPFTDSRQKFFLKHFRDLLFSRVWNHPADRSVPVLQYSPPLVGKYSSPQKKKENQPHYVEQIGFGNICFLLVMVVLICSLPP